VAVQITRKDLTPAQVWLAANGGGAGGAADAGGRAGGRWQRPKGAAETCGTDRQTLGDRVHRGNAEGLAGLAIRPSPGRRPRLASEQNAERRGLKPAPIPGATGWCAGGVSA
jgi:hypothetical protein